MKKQKPVEMEITDASFRAIADSTYDWESWFAPNGRLIWVNAAVERVTGFTPDECLAMDDYPLPMVAPAHRESIASLMSDANGETTFNNVEFQSVHRNGEKRWMAVSAQPMFDESACGNIGITGWKPMPLQSGESNPLASFQARGR